MMVLLGILLVLLFLLLLPVGVKAQYDQAGGRLVAYFGPVSLTIYPSTKEKKSADQESKDKSAKDSGEKKKRGGGISLFRELLGLGLEALGCLRRRLLLKNLTLYLTIGAMGKEPAQWGMLYGGAWAAVGNLIPLLERVFRIEARDIQVELDEETQESSVVFFGQCRLLLGEILYLLLHYGLRGLRIYSKWKGSNEHGTSNQ